MAACSLRSGIREGGREPRPHTPQLELAWPHRQSVCVPAQVLACLPRLQGRPYQAAVLDSEAAALPARGKPVADAAEAAAVAALAAAVRGGR